MPRHINRKALKQVQKHPKQCKNDIPRKLSGTLPKNISGA